jgi:lipid II:glycine glycyltransferase (peptidoglycan interpeptide bridge formation enzyme)
MAPILIASRETWNAALASLPLAHVLQTWEWGQFKSRHGWTPSYLLWNDDSPHGGAGLPKAAALVLRRRLSRLPLCILYVPKGPAMDYADTPLVNQVLSDLERLARKSRAIFIKIEPDVLRSRTPLSLIGRGVGGEGWRPSAEQIQFRNTMEIDLRRSEDELLAAMHQKTRYNIRLAQKRGVTVRVGGLADLELLYSMYDETAQRDHFIIRPFEYYQDAWGSFIEAGLAQPLVAEFKGTPITAIILFHFARRAYYFYGMSLDLHRNLMPTYLLQWEAMRWAQTLGCAIYDLWGAPDELSESDPMWGVYRFKQGFGGQFVEHIGAWDYAVSHRLYWLYTFAMPRVLDLMRRRHWTREASKMQVS